MSIVKCEWCGRKFNFPSGTGFYCSKRCQAAAKSNKRSASSSGSSRVVKSKSSKSRKSRTFSKSAKMWGWIILIIGLLIYTFNDSCSGKKEESVKTTVVGNENKNFNNNNL